MSLSRGSEGSESSAPVPECPIPPVLLHVFDLADGVWVRSPPSPSISRARRLLGALPVFAAARIEP
jgi:hypothetical protein